MIPRFVRCAARALAPLLLLLPAACRRQVAEVRPTIPLVREILSSRTDARAQMLRDRAVLPASDIAIIGPELACERLAEMFLFRDAQDNVDARWHRDGLPDFAGETFACIEDALPYADVLGARGAEELRSQTLLRVLSAIDTVVHISPYDIDGLGTKPSSKMVVLADPYLAEYGGFDVDTLFRSTGCRVPVVSPVELMIGRALDRADRSGLSVGILCEPQYEASGIYERIFARMAAERQIRGAEVVVSGVSARDSVLHAFMEKYVASGPSRPLDAILIDHLSVPADSLKSELAEIVSVMNESSMIYGRHVSRDFYFLDAFDEVSAVCYNFLRENNLFTHNIAKPQVTFYRPVKRPGAEDGSIILIPGSYVQN